MSATDVMGMPAMKPPPGVVPVFENPPSGNAMTLAVLSVCLAVSVIAVALRLYSRCVIAGALQLQDYLLLLSFALYTSLIGVYYHLATNPGWFIHMWNLRIRDMIEFLHVGIITTCIALVFMMAIKAAILIEWLRIFLPNCGNRRSPFFWACHFVIWANIVYCSTTIILVNLACVPHEYLWNRTLPGGYCRINTAYTSLSAACFAFSTDVIILLIPQRVIWKLNMSRKRKLGVSVVFALGLGACATAIVRLVYTVGRAGSDDLTYHLSSVQLTAVGEGACAILVLCVPAIPKAVSGLKLPDLLSSIPSWSRLVSFSRRRPSQESLGKENIGTSAWPIPSQEADDKPWKTGSSSERHLVPLAHINNAKDHDPEFGNAIFRSTEFETITSYDSSRAAVTEQHNRQQPWMQNS